MLKTLMPSITELVSFSYEDIKTDKTESLIAEILEGYTPSSHPKLIQISGIPGSGKSTYCSNHKLPNFLFLSFDKIMLMMEDYQQLLHQKGCKIAFQTYEMPARVIGYEVLSRAIASNLNIMFEHSGANNAHLEMFQNITKIGYETSVIFIICNTSIAIERAQKREQETNRHVPKNLITERAQKQQEYIKRYKALTQDITLLDGADNFKPLNKI